MSSTYSTILGLKWVSSGGLPLNFIKRPFYHTRQFNDSWQIKKNLILNFDKENLLTVETNDLIQVSKVLYAHKILQASSLFHCTVGHLFRELRDLCLPIKRMFGWHSHNILHIFRLLLEPVLFFVTDRVIYKKSKVPA